RTSGSSTDAAGTCARPSKHKLRAVGPDQHGSDILRTLDVVRIASLCLLGAPLAAGAQPHAYVANQSSNVVHVVRTSDGQVLNSIPVGLAPTGIAIPSVGGFALVANKGGNSVSRIDLASS